ncbi:MAG: endonuclease/exonuclease/phosphatase family protein, partial [Rubripirellula sp.]
MMARVHAFLFLILLCAPGWADSERTLRILSYNIHHGAGTDRKLDLERIADVIQSAKPDIVSLQEVDQRVPRSRSVDQPAELARLTGMNVAFHGNIPLQGGQYGNAILSRYPIESSEHVLLPNHDQGEQRGLIVVRFDSDVFRDLRFIATHFDHRRDETERVLSAEFVNEMIKQHPQEPYLLAGDLNATRESRTLRILQESWRIAGPQLATIPVDQPKRQIDFILYRPTDRWNVIETRILSESVASDHRAILTVLRLRPQNADSTSKRTLDIETADGKWSRASSVEQWQQRRRSILTAMHSVMGELPKASSRSAPQMTLIEEVDCGNYVRRKITYTAQPNNETPAYLCIP